MTPRPWSSADIAELERLVTTTHMTLTEIGKELFISSKTVEAHLAKIREKWDVISTRIPAVWYASLELLEWESEEVDEVTR